VPVVDAVTGDGALVIGTARRRSCKALGWDDVLKASARGLRDPRHADRRQRAIVVASPATAARSTARSTCCACCRRRRRSSASTCARSRAISCACSIHWDNLDGSIERGYAGRSLWKWDELPATIDPRLHDYARANASIGLNGTVINSVNANPKSLTADYIAKAAAIADVFRPYG
jgi:alpha-glucuronidase